MLRLVVALFSLLLVGCGSGDGTDDSLTADTTEDATDVSTDGGESTSSITATTTADSSATTSATSGGTDGGGDSSSTASSGSNGGDGSGGSTAGGSGGTGTGGVADADLPGEAFDGFAAAGETMMVVGVAHDDDLNIRSIPGTDGDILATASPTADNLVATGRARILPGSVWYEVTADGVTGWVASSFVAFAGFTDDATAEFLDGGDPPQAETMVDMADLVTARYASVEPPSTIIQTVAPTVGDLAEVTYDVVGIGDDGLAGYRLHLFATPGPNGETFTLKSIERTLLCSRGATADGLCL